MSANGQPTIIDKVWLVDAATLLAEPDPGPTPWLVENLIVDQALAELVGRWKTTKSYATLELLVSIATGEPAFGRLKIPTPGPVIYICEESGRAALWRRLDALCRGRAIDRDRLRDLHLAANQRVKLDDPAWQAELVAMGRELGARAIALDPLVRMKAATRDENAQKEMAVVIEFLRELRDETGASPWFVHHTGHQGTHGRGTSDLESVWETKLTWTREGTSPEVKIEAEHREAETSPPIRYRISWDADTRSIRFPLIEDGLLERVRDHLAEHPEDTANDVHKALGGRKTDVLKAVRDVLAEGGSHDGNHPGTTTSGTPSRGGSHGTPFRGPGTTDAESSLQLVPEPGTGTPADHLDEHEIERLATLARDLET